MEFENGIKSEIKFVNDEILENEKLNDNQIENIYKNFINDDFINDEINQKIMELIRNEIKK